MGEWTAICERLVKLGLGVAKLVVGGDRVSFAKDAFGLFTDGRDIYADIGSKSARELASRLTSTAEVICTTLAQGQDWSETDLHDARAHLEQALPYCRIEPSDLAALNMEPTAVVTHLRLNIVRRGGDAVRYLNQPSPSRTLFEDVLSSVLGDLLSDPAFASGIAPHLWRESLTRLERIDSKLDELHDRLGVAEAALRGFYRALTGARPSEAHAMTTADIEDALLPRLEEFRRTQERLRSRTNDPAEWDELRGQAADLNDQGKFDEATALLRRLSRMRVDAARQKEDEARRDLLAAAEDLCLAAATEGQELKYRDAATLFIEAAELVTFNDRERWRHMLEAAIAFESQGKEFGDKAALETAIQILEVERDVGHLRSQRPKDWALTQNNLGNVLWIAGARENGSEKLLRAAEAIRGALEVWTIKDDLSDWAMASCNLGNIFATLGEREDDVEQTQLAVDCYANIRVGITRAGDHGFWTTVAANYGAALRALGTRKNDIELLEQSRTVLEEISDDETRDAAPFEWARGQTNLGNLQYSIGQMSNGFNAYDAALRAFGASLTVYTRDRMPMAWAQNKNSVGAVHLAVGKANGDEDSLKKAIESFDESLQEFTTSRAPLDRANSIANSAVAQSELAALIGDREGAEAAISSLRSAIPLLQDGGDLSGVAHFTVHLAKAEEALQRLTSA